MLSEDFIAHIEKELANWQGSAIRLESTRPVGGGSINDAYRLQTNEGTFFMKVNNSQAFPGMFEAEAKGLDLLNSNSRLRIPRVHLQGTMDNKAYLIMEYLEREVQTVSFWDTFGEQLADMHRQQNDLFGLDHDNYIGSLPQKNDPKDSWSEFFIVNRLEPMIRMGNTDHEVNHLFDRFFSKLDSIFPKEPPAFIHGDLWSGNFNCDDNGMPTIFDPAVYYGHREMDIGMSKLFGGFDRSFYQAYQENYPMENGWENRIDIANLYPLMVHVNLFGGSYLASVRSILKQFS